MQAKHEDGIGLKAGDSYSMIGSTSVVTTTSFGCCTIRVREFHSWFEAPTHLLAHNIARSADSVKLANPRRAAMPGAIDIRHFNVFCPRGVSSHRDIAQNSVLSCSNRGSFL